MCCCRRDHACICRFEVEDHAPIMYVYEVQIEQRAQRQGLGPFLMTFLKLYAKKNQLERIMLTVMDVSSCIPLKSCLNLTIAFGQHRVCLCRETQQLSKCIQSLGTSQILRPPHKQTLLVIWKILQAMRFCLCNLCSFAQAGRRRGIMPSAICPSHLARSLLVLIQCTNNILFLHRVYFTLIRGIFLLMW